MRTRHIGFTQQALWLKELRTIGSSASGSTSLVQQAATFEVAVNLKAAKSLGLTIPPAILAGGMRCMAANFSRTLRGVSPGVQCTVGGA